MGQSSTIRADTKPIKKAAAPAPAPEQPKAELGNTARKPSAGQEVRAAELPRLLKLSQEDQRGELRNMPPDRRAELLKQYPSKERMLLLGSSAVHGDIHDTGPTFEPKWDQTPLKRGYHPSTAWAMSVAAKRAYEPFSADGSAQSTQSVKDFQDQGYQVTLLGTKAGKTTQGFLATKDGKAILSFRGTEPKNVQDWATDGNFSKVDGHGGRVHEGFQRAFGEVWGDVEGALNAAQAKLPKGEKLSLHVTGHSLGAALATVAASQIDDRMKNVSVDGVYTFGSPRVFDGEAAAAYDGRLGDRTFRFENNADIVAKVPKLNYAHVGKHLYFDHLGNQHVAPSEAFMIREETLGATENALENRKARDFEPEWTWDHGPQGYVKHLFVNTNSRAVP